MNALQEENGIKNFAVLGFPCNQFGKQEPGGNDTEIMDGIRWVRPGGGFDPNFQIFKKIDVNGEKQHPLYEWLKSQCDPPELTFRNPDKLFYKNLHTHDIRWNWEKFLINHEGIPYKRYAPHVKPKEIAPDINLLLQELNEARRTQ